MEDVGIVNVGRYKAAVKKHSEHNKEREYLPARQAFFSKAIGEADGQKKAAGGSCRCDQEGNSVCFQHHTAIGGEHPFISIDAPFFREKRVPVAQKGPIGGQG